MGEVTAYVVNRMNSCIIGVRAIIWWWWRNGGEV